jgi:hypothetical protein
MPSNARSIRKLAEQVGGFHLRGGALQRAQRRIVALLEAGDPISQREADTYVAQTRNYFTAFEREAREHLKDVEKRLSHIDQLQFNLTAERGVAQRRIEAVRGVLADLESVVP